MKKFFTRIWTFVSGLVDLVTMAIIFEVIVLAPITIIFSDYMKKVEYDTEIQTLKDSEQLSLMMKNNAMKSYRIYHDIDDTYRTSIIMDNDGEKFLVILDRKSMNILFCINISNQVTLDETSYAISKE